jgi:fatty acid desaturase
MVYVLPSPVTYLAGLALIGIFQHQFLIIQHETMHYYLFNSRLLNNFVSSVVSYMIG